MEGMTKADKLGLCDWMLVFSTTVAMASSIQLEATGSRDVLWVWLHVVVGCLFFANIVWHLYLHFGWRSWIQRLRKQKSRVTRWLAILAFLTFISAFIALVHWAGAYMHSPIGGIHGKIGLVFLVFAIGHTVKRIRFFKSRRLSKCA